MLNIVQYMFLSLCLNSKNLLANKQELLNFFANIADTYAEIKFINKIPKNIKILEKY